MNHIGSEPMINRHHDAIDKESKLQELGIYWYVSTQGALGVSANSNFEVCGEFYEFSGSTVTRA
jgi:hypothetical protein